RYYAIAKKEDFMKRSLARLVKDYFNDSYKNAVSALGEEEKMSDDELREVMELIESKNAKK
ncbi:MAG: BlaI/MecI/CopY family transcriptional regulator, partial [Duncaniella sp.]|nr:BlaI/MecI/CopY family transcriptional regulator [Duncaniella sp.]